MINGISEILLYMMYMGFFTSLLFTIEFKIGPFSEYLATLFNCKIYKSEIHTHHSIATKDT